MLTIRQLNIEDGQDIFLMLKDIESNENEFTNPVKEMEFKEFKEWLILMDNWSKGKELKESYVPQTIFWLFENEIPVGIGKIRHKLTEASRAFGGNIGYAIAKKYRGKGYATIFLNKLIEEAKKLNISEKILTVEKYNNPSKRVIEKNGGIIIDENDKRWILEIE